MTRQNFRSLAIVIFSILVRIAVQFNDESAFRAIEVGDKSIDRMLPAELEIFQLPISQTRPEFLLCWGRFIPHGPGKCEEFSVDSGGAAGHTVLGIRCPSPCLSPAYGGEK